MAELIYCGPRVGKGDKRIEKFEELPGRKSLCFTKITGQHFSIGGVYEIEEVKPGSFAVNRAKWLREFENPEAVEIMEAESIAARRELEGNAEAKRRAKDMRLNSHVNALRMAYSQLPAVQKLGFEVWLLSQLRRLR